MEVKKAATFSLGHPGVVYNFKDSNNYDFAYIRTHSNSGECGSMVNGGIVWQGGIGNTGGYLHGGRWNSLEVKVTEQNNFAEISLNGKKIANCGMRHPKSARGGLWIGNGYGNIFQFRNFKIELTPNP